MQAHGVHSPDGPDTGTQHFAHLLKLSQGQLREVFSNSGQEFVYMPSLAYAVVL